MNTTHAILMIAVSSLVTIGIRFFPFAVFRGRETPPLISYLGKVLPYAIMAMLVVYCLKDVKIQSYPYGGAEWIAVAMTVVLHVWKRNTLLSIVGGTITYMLLIQLVFA